MSWLDKVPPRIKSLFRRNATPESLWIKCPLTGTLVFHRDVEENLWVIPGSEHHFPLTAIQRLSITFDEGRWDDVPVEDMPADPLKFRDRRRHSERIKDARKQTGLADAIALGSGTIGGVPVIVAAHDFKFVGGTLGMAAGETVITGLKLAIERRIPFIIFTALPRPRVLLAANLRVIKSAETLTLFSTLPTLCSTLVAISAMPALRAVSSNSL